MHYRPALAGSLVLLILVTGCARTEAPAGSTAGFEAFVKAAARKPVAELNADELTEAVEQYIGMQVASASATKTGLDKDPSVQAQLDLGRMNVLTEALLTRYLEANTVTDAEVQAEYAEQVANVPLEYKARHILVDDRDLAVAIIEKLAAGGDFADQARQYSRDGSASGGGDLGWFTGQTMVQPFAAAVAALEKGAYTTEPVQTQFGWHVILLEDARSPTLPELEAVREQLQQIVQRKKIKAHLLALREGSGINVEKQTADLLAYARSADATATPGTAATP